MIYSSEQYLDDCLRLRGGIAPDEHTNRAVREVLSDLAAARREVETVTRERDEAKAAAASIVQLNVMLGQQLEASRAVLEGVRKEVKTVTCWAKAAEADLATSRAALEDVRRVEAWLRDWVGEDRRTIRYAVGEFEALDYDGEYMAGEQSLEALGRALAQEAGE